MSGAGEVQRPGRRTQAERRDESGRGLVAAAVAVVSDEGVSAATFDNIGRRCGYSRGLVGQRFGSKQGLIEAVIAHLQSNGGEEAARKLAEKNGLDALLAYVDFHLVRLASSPEGRAYFRLLAWAVADIAPQKALFAG